MPEPTRDASAPAATAFSPTRIGLAWGVHLFTAAGAVLAAIALVAIGDGDFRTAAMLMLATLVIDSADGTMARAVGVREVLPGFDGRRLDDIIDFLNYVIVPVVFMLAAGNLPHWSVGAFPILASCYGFSQVAAKTEDGFFLGFPSYWNFVALYAWGLGVAPAIGTVVVVILSIGVFVPLKYLPEHAATAATLVQRSPRHPVGRRIRHLPDRARASRSASPARTQPRLPRLLLRAVVVARAAQRVAVMSRTGVLLVNLGTPDSPSARDVRRYLRQFLSDPLVIDIPALPRWLLLNLVILPFRPRKSAAAYAQIWTDQGSPLKVYGESLRDGVAASLGDDFHVELAMRYAEPSIASAVSRAQAAGVTRCIVLPLFPQYSTAATKSATDAVEAAFATAGDAASVDVIGAFYDDPGFIEAFAGVTRQHLAAFRPDHVLFSYHGLPERQLRTLDPSGAHCLERADCCDAVTDANHLCYRAQCVATTRLLARELGLGQDAHSLSFQSRLGRTPWIQPYTDFVLPELAARGVKRLAIACPAFVADCLETLQEIAIRGRDQWLELGGEELSLVPSLNSNPVWVNAVGAMIRERADAR